MAKGRTVSSSQLTETDRKAVGLCEAISAAIVRAVGDQASEFSKKYGKIDPTRDGGLGLGGGKLQRDALCTRGRGGKAPFSNRNLRWHPLVVADAPVPFARPIERIEVEEERDGATLTFVVSEQGREIAYPAEKAHEIRERRVALPEHWRPHAETLKRWDDLQWTQNSCVIAAQEACDWSDAVESYAVLGASVAAALYGADIRPLFGELAEILERLGAEAGARLPSPRFPQSPEDAESATLCPVCKKRINEGLDEFRRLPRPATWQPEWRASKKSEGDDNSMQILHVMPLVENEIRHNAANVRFGHRWCNVAMADHSLDETLNFMEHVVAVHDRGKR